MQPHSSLMFSLPQTGWLGKLIWMTVTVLRPRSILSQSSSPSPGCPHHHHHLHWSEQQLGAELSPRHQFLLGSHHCQSRAGAAKDVL